MNYMVLDGATLTGAILFNVNATQSSIVDVDLTGAVLNVIYADGVIPR